MEQDIIRDMDYGYLGVPCPTSAAFLLLSLLPNGRPASTKSCDLTNNQTSCSSCPAGLSPISKSGGQSSTGPHGNRLSKPCRCRFPERDPGPAVRLCTCVLSFVRQCLCIKPSSLCLAVGKTPAIRRRLPIVPRVHDEPHQTYMALVHHLRSLTAGRLPSKEIEKDHGSS